MDVTAAVHQLFDRFPALTQAAVEDLEIDDLAWRPDADANSIAWLVWHSSRVQDDHLARAAQALGWDDLTDQVWTADGFSGRFGLPFDDDAIGYGQSSDEVAQVRASADLLLAYQSAVHDRTGDVLDRVADAEWDAVVDDAWDPPVTLTARLVSVIGDVTQHLGQAAYVRGLLERGASQD